MATCITGSRYGDTEVRSDLKIDKWVEVDGLKTTSETMIIVIVDAGGSTGLFYVGLPDRGPEFVDPARQALRELRVDPLIEGPCADPDPGSPGHPELLPSGESLTWNGPLVMLQDI